MHWPTWFNRRRDEEITEEIESHLQMAIRDRVERGESPADARRRALIEFGSPMLAKEAARSVWTWTAMEQLATDLHIGARILWRAPGLSAAAVLLIALVIGGNMTIFSMVHAVLAKPAAGVRARGLVTLGWVADGEEHPACSYPDYIDIAAASRTLMPMLAQEFGRFVLTTPDGSYAVQGATVSSNYFDTLGVRPTLGRTFSEREGKPNASGLVALISDRVWRERFAGSSDVVGQTTIVSGHVVTIIGVAPPEFRGVAFAESADIWMPLAAYAEIDGQQKALNDRRSPSLLLFTIGRLAPGISMPEAQAELTTLARQLPRAPGDRSRNRTIRLFPYSATAAGDSFVAQRGPWFLAMFSMVTALTLLIAYGNVANLMLARAAGRAREMAVRQSLGASRARIVRIFAAEALVIATTAWAAAALIAFWTTRAIPRLMPPLGSAGSQIAFDFTPDWSVLGYAMLLALAGAVFISVAPGLRTYRQDLQPLLKAGEQGVVQRRSTVSNGLVVLQLAFSVLLLTTAGLAYRSLSVLNASDLGFDRTNLLLVTINTNAAAPSGDANSMLLNAMLDRLRAVPGITAASYARRPIQSFWPRERLSAASGGPEVVAERDEVGPGYLRVLGLVPVAGVDFGAPDHRGALPAIVNQRLAGTLWPGQSAIGRTMRLSSSRQSAVITGVAPDGYYNGYRRDAEADFVMVSASDAAPASAEMTLYIRYSGSIEQIVPAIGRALRSVDDRAPIVYVRTMDEQLESLTWPIRALAVLLAMFAMGSLLIATIGQYAAMTFTVRRRIRDFGVRIALGASSREIVASALRDGLGLTVAGLAMGGVLSLVAASSLRSMLFGVTPTDARTYAGVVALLGSASLVACYLPAFRAGRIDPMEALREE